MVIGVFRSAMEYVELYRLISLISCTTELKENTESRENTGPREITEARNFTEKIDRKSCKTCQQRRVKCDKLRPACVPCQRRQCACIYDAIPKKRDLKTDILDPLFKIVDELENRLRDEKTPPHTAVPVNIITRGFQKLPEWNAEGELTDRFPSSTVLPWLAKLFGDISFQDGVELHSQICSFFRNVPDIIFTGSITDAHISMTKSSKRKILEELPKDDRTEILFEILSLAIHGFPEPDTEIAPRLEEQYLPIVKFTCLPFLEAVHFDDILSYCQGTPDGGNILSTQLDYLIALWRFLQRITRTSQLVFSSRIRYLEHQIEAHILSIKSEDHLLSYTYLKASRDVTHALNSHSLQRLQDSIKRNQSVHEPRINAVIGTTILQAINNTPPLISAWKPAVWMPLEREVWSCFERYVLILARGQYSPSNAHKLPLQTEVLVAFEMARIGQFSVAQEVLLRRIPEVQKRYGNGSAEFIACGIELAVCCNFLADPVLGGEWARKISTISGPYLQLNSRTYATPEFNLSIAGVDTEIGQGQYRRASKELQGLINLEDLPSRHVLMVALRLLKSIRRQGDLEFNEVFWNAYEKALHHAAYVSDFLKHELILEALCIFSVFRKQFEQFGDGPERAQTMLRLTISMIEQLLDQPERSIPTPILERYLENLYGHQKVLNRVSAESPSYRAFQHQHAGLNLGMEDQVAASTFEQLRHSVSNTHSQILSPQSPIGNHSNERTFISGKSLISSDYMEDGKAGEPLKDFSGDSEHGRLNLLSRRAKSPQLPTGRLSLKIGSTIEPSAIMPVYTNQKMSSVQPQASARAGGYPIRQPRRPPAINELKAKPTTKFEGSKNFATRQGRSAFTNLVRAISPTAITYRGPPVNYQLESQHYQRHNFPPVNPADQNPPCNTLYVGNLPIDTSEDELKVMFSKQRGYKRLCFRTKQSGPMCFVEFEDVSFATKALHELYGHPLHNSVKGGIRLSFSKNPLGVRSGQGARTPGPITPTIGMKGLIGMMNGMPFGIANGPPPGLTAPPGLAQSPSSFSGDLPSLNGGANQFTANGFSRNGWNEGSFSGAMAAGESASIAGNINSGFPPPYMMGQ